MASVRWLLALVSAGAASLFAGCGGDPALLATREARDVMVSDIDGVVLARADEPGRHMFLAPCAFARSGEEAVGLVVKEENHAWSVDITWNGEALTSFVEPDTADVEAPCAHVPGFKRAVHAEVRHFLETDLLVGDQRVVAEVADTPDARSYGLQGRDRLRDDHGMWFVYSEPAPLRFVMKTVSFPLDIAFVGADGVIINIVSLNPGDLRDALSLEPAQYVLEMEQGWFYARGLGEGSTVQWPDEVAQPRALNER